MDQAVSWPRKLNDWQWNKQLTKGTTLITPLNQNKKAVKKTIKNPSENKMIVLFVFCISLSKCKGQIKKCVSILTSCQGLYNYYVASCVFTINIDPNHYNIYILLFVKWSLFILFHFLFLYLLGGDLFGNCQRPVFSLGVSQRKH